MKVDGPSLTLASLDREADVRGETHARAATSDVGEFRVKRLPAR